MPGRREGEGRKNVENFFLQSGRKRESTQRKTTICVRCLSGPTKDANRRGKKTKNRFVRMKIKKKGGGPSIFDNKNREPEKGVKIFCSTIPKKTEEKGNYRARGAKVGVGGVGGGV